MFSLIFSKEKDEVFLERIYEKTKKLAAVIDSKIAGITSQKAENVNLKQILQQLISSLNKSVEEEDPKIGIFFALIND